jgi:hypothetical protein
MQIAMTPYGRVAGAICFDLDHPAYVRAAGAGAADLMLQPSWTWGSIGPRHFVSDMLRSVENGFTLFRWGLGFGVFYGLGFVLAPRDVHHSSAPWRMASRCSGGRAAGGEGGWRSGFRGMATATCEVDQGLPAARPACANANASCG